MKKRLLPLLAVGLLLVSCTPKVQTPVYEAKDFVRVDNAQLVDPSGSAFAIKGVNLGQWLYPQAEAFGFETALPTAAIEATLKAWVGEAFPSIFWNSFKENFITKEDLAYLASQGVNTVRLPFHYKSFTHKDYLDKENMQDGFQRVDSLVAWSKANGLYVVLCMAAAPGGQTGDGTDDGYAYPFLFNTVHSQQRLIDIWTEIATRYAQEPTILGYELMAKPVGTQLSDAAELCAQVAPLYKEVTEAIRAVDPFHVIILDGAPSGTALGLLKEVNFDKNLLFAGAKCGGETDKEALKEFIGFRVNANRAVYMSELAGDPQWMEAMATTLKENRIGYTFSDYKGCTPNAMVQYALNESWLPLSAAVNDPKAPRPTVDQVKSALMSFADRVKLANCTPNPAFIEALKLK